MAIEKGAMFTVFVVPINEMAGNYVRQRTIKNPLSSQVDLLRRASLFCPKTRRTFLWTQKIERSFVRNAKWFVKWNYYDAYVLFLPTVLTTPFHPQKPYWPLSSRRNYNLVIYNDRLMSETLSMSDDGEDDGMDGEHNGGHVRSVTIGGHHIIGSKLGSTQPQHLTSHLGRSPLNSTPGTLMLEVSSHSTVSSNGSKWKTTAFWLCIMVPLNVS